MSQNFKVKNGLDINGVQIIAANGQLTGPAATQITNIISSSPTSDDWSRGQANASFAQANTATTNAATADQKAVTSGLFANAAFGVANTATTNAATADQKAVSAGSYANSAFGVANTISILAQSAFNAANSAGGADTFARETANSAGSYANSAYAKANTIPTAVSQLTNDSNFITSSSLSGYATESYVGTQISNLVDSAPTTLDTLNELAAALGDDANFSTTLTNMVGVSGGYANSAYSQANTATTNAATADQRAVTSGSFANSAYSQANTASVNAISAGSYANSAFAKANTALTSVPNDSTQVSSLGVGTAASGTTGEIRATNDITAFYSSDNRLKENIQDVSNALQKVCAIGSKTYDWKDEHISQKGGEDGYFVRKSDFGVIAQDVEAVFPQAVRTRKDGTKVVDYEKLGTLAFGAIKELVIRIEALESK